MGKISGLRKAGLKEKNRILLLSAAVSVIMSLTAGCGGGPPEASDTGITAADSGGYPSGEDDCADAEPVAAIYREIYDEAAEKIMPDSLEVIRGIIRRLGENGYAAVDGENQVDMVCPEQIREFCGKVEAREEAEATLIVVISATSFYNYEFVTKEGKVEVLCAYYLYREGRWERAGTDKYPAYTWAYSDEGYLFFEEYRMPGFDGPSGHTAVRTEPLGERCRELNRKYVRTVGYELNNLFTSDWNEDDFQELNFYDLFEVLYRMKNERYAAAGFFEEGVIYEIPESEFESVFQTFFRTDSRTLRQYTVYHEDTKTYRYRARGMSDFAPTPYIPYPEVVSFEENQDGTISLTVNAVWPEKNLGKAFCHELVIRPLKDGGFQFVSNHVIPSEDNVEITWYTERLSDAEWQEYYGGMEGILSCRPAFCRTAAWADYFTTRVSGRDIFCFTLYPN